MNKTFKGVLTAAAIAVTAPAFADGSSTLPPGNYFFGEGNGATKVTQVVKGEMDAGACTNCQAPINVIDVKHSESLDAKQSYNFQITGTAGTTGAAANPNLVQAGNYLNAQDMGPVKAEQSVRFSFAAGNCETCAAPINHATVKNVANVDMTQKYDFTAYKPEGTSTTAKSAAQNNLQ
ncbi:MAG: hypothetical protein ABTQ34_08395 [Bdellovibrionales bacterium]